MDLDEYQELANKTAIYPDRGTNAGLLYVTLGLCGESGEVAEKVKKLIRDDDGKLTQERKEKIINELGDVLWYLSNIASELNVSLKEIAVININKLNSRKDRNQLHGDGDER